MQITLNPTTPDAFQAASTSDPNSKPVTGTGDQAFVNNYILSFRHGMIWVDVNWTSFTGGADSRLPAEKTLAAKIIAKLG
ncbi:hypothetical protein [Fodinicola feengrottensis]|uniref:Uncharacterized protein n=1 Tax=Fodinicola feengrottensis TaxID=435914 RepID=A0ABN2ISK6_9ACTN|nr:hypothetical protein [Fodinicola feengrottensis]